MKHLRGYLLLPVSLALALVAAVAFLLAEDGGARNGQTARRMQADAARGLAEAGFNQLLWRLNQKNCTSYTDLPATSLSGGTYSATVTPKSGTPVTITATGTLPDGTHAQVVRRDVVVYGPATTRSLQPDSAGIDTYIDKGGSTRNYGAATLMWVSPDWDNALMRWDLGTIPRAASIRSAVLRLDALAAPSGGGGAVTVHRVTRTWSEGTQNGSGTADGATWTTQDGIAAWSNVGGDYESAPSASRNVVDSNWHGWEIGPLVQEWVSGRIANQGLLLKSDATTVKFASSDDGTTAQRPALDLTYALPCGMSSGPTTGTLAPEADTELDGTLPAINWGSDPQMWIVNTDKGVKETPVVRFDLQGIAPGSTVSQARLRVYVELATMAGGSSAVEVYNVTEAWDEGTRRGTGTADGASWNNRKVGVAWTTAGGTTSASPTASTNVAGTFTNGWLEFDLTALVQQWVDFPATNFGAALRVVRRKSELRASTREAAANKPELVVTYQ